ncbi:Rhodanese-like domain-containing protein [Chytridium lagenaria]|nr:Rhodanese-like domain-containing protein [Chytridium lagenaria]
MATPDFVERETVAAWFKDPSLKNGVDYQIIDVRGDDFAGGHIIGARNIRAVEFLENLDKYHSEVSQCKKLIFHCVSSRGRGPRCANAYMSYLNEKEEELRPEVLVLKGGFRAWQEVYKTDGALVEGYDEEFWKEMEEKIKQQTVQQLQQQVS